MKYSVESSSYLFELLKIIAKETIYELSTYARAGHIVQEVFSTIRTVHSLNGSEFERKRYSFIMWNNKKRIIAHISLSYEKELYPTQRCGIRKGTFNGIFVGWLSLMTFVVYAIGFIFGSLLMPKNDHEKSNIVGILIVSNL